MSDAVEYVKMTIPDGPLMGQDAIVPFKNGYPAQTYIRIVASEQIPVLNRTLAVPHTVREYRYEIDLWRDEAKGDSYKLRYKK